MHQRQEKSRVERQLSAARQDHPIGSPPFLGESNYILGRTQSLLGRLAKAIYPERASLQQLEMAGPVDRISLREAMTLEYRSAEIGESLGPTFATFWFRLKIQIPREWQGRRVDLAWSSNSEALLWMDGRSVQGFNLGRETARIVDEAAGGEELTLYVEVACNHLLGADGVDFGNHGSTPAETGKE